METICLYFACMLITGAASPMHGQGWPIDSKGFVIFWHLMVVSATSAWLGFGFWAAVVGVIYYWAALRRSWQAEAELNYLSGKGPLSEVVVVYMLQVWGLLLLIPSAIWPFWVLLPMAPAIITRYAHRRGFIEAFTGIVPGGLVVALITHYLAGVLQ